MYSQFVIDKVKESTSLAEVVAGYVPLKKQSSRMIGLCPFHQEDTPSFGVHTDGYWKCFGCQAGGDVFTFLQRVEDISFADALKRLADRAGISLDQKPISRVAMAYAREEAAIARWWWERKLARLTQQGLADWTDEMDLEMCGLVTLPLARVLALTIPERFAEFRARATEAERREWRAAVSEEREFAEAWMRLAA